MGRMEIFILKVLVIWVSFVLFVVAVMVICSLELLSL